MTAIRIKLPSCSTDTNQPDRGVATSTAHTKHASVVSQFEYIRTVSFVGTEPVAQSVFAVGSAALGESCTDKIAQ